MRTSPNATIPLASPHAAFASTEARRARQPHRFYRASLPREQHAAYDALLTGLMHGERTIAVPGRCCSGSFGRLLDGLKLDNPELFAVEGLSVVNRAFGRSKVAVEPAYRFGAHTVRTTLEALAAETEGIVNAVRGRSDFETVRALHDWLIARFTYDAADPDHANEASGAILFGRGVCEGASKAFKYLCDRCGIPSIVAVGQAHGNPSVPDGAGGSESHAWNLVRLKTEAGTCWYHVDLTYDAALSTACSRYDYLCLSDAEIALDRAVDADVYPRCPRSFDYYRRIGRFADSQSALRRIARQARAAQENPLVFQLPRMDGADEAFARDLMRAVGRELAPLALHPRRASMSHNLTRMVFQVGIEPP